MTAECIKIGIFGYGNLGRGAEKAVLNAPDMELTGVFTRRDPRSLSLLNKSVPALPAKEVRQWQDRIDVMLVCGGSATDLPRMTPELARCFSVVDSFDNHARIPAHFQAVDEAAASGNRLALISCGWDPGLFSINRLLGECVLPEGCTNTFWGRGVSQGHSEAIRNIPGVEDARQYTVPLNEAVCSAREEYDLTLNVRSSHKRECYVALKEGADPEEVRERIVTMPDYFEGYRTEVHFISVEELKREHGGLAHGGRVIRNGRPSGCREDRGVMEFSLELCSNPAFTGSVMTAFARGVHRMYQRGRRGCVTVFDVAPGDLAVGGAQELRARLL